MSENARARYERDRERRRRFSYLLIGALALVFFIVRLQITPRYDHEDFQALYGELCHALQGDGDDDALYREARRQLRHAPNNAEVVFFFQFVGEYTGRVALPAELATQEAPIHAAAHEGDFEGARTLVKAAVFDDASMSAGRGDAWAQLLRSLEARWAHGCALPAGSAASGS